MFDHFYLPALNDLLDHSRLKNNTIYDSSKIFTVVRSEMVPIGSR